MADEVKTAERVVESAAEQLVADVVTTVRKHPQYIDIVNRLTDQAITALLAGL